MRVKEQKAPKPPRPPPLAHCVKWRRVTNASAIVPEAAYCDVRLAKPGPGRRCWNAPAEYKWGTRVQEAENWSNYDGPSS